MKFVLTDGSAADEHMTLQTLHSAAYSHDNSMNLHRNLPSRGQNQHLIRQEKGTLLSKQVHTGVLGAYI